MYQRSRGSCNRVQERDHQIGIAVCRRTCRDTEGVQYCFAPKHTVGEQLLTVRRDKRERAAYAAAGIEEPDDDEEEGEEDRYADDEGSYRDNLEGSNGIGEDSRTECE